MVTTAQLPVNLADEERTSIRLLLERLIERHSDEVQQVVLFGSKARGDFDTDSDIDLLVLVKNESWELRNSIWSLAARIELDYNVLFNVHVIGIERWKQMTLDQFSLCRNVEKDGILLFSRS
ncbi:MAG TPA: nucleotidyltransferase domain-containing protein [Anaerolineales bacterium]|nr:nucleotidyltransferase domain-containing protein [Anaerolineales bacterium]